MIGYTIMRLFGNKDGSHPNHDASLEWHPYPEDKKYCLCCVMNSEPATDQVWLGTGNKWYHCYKGNEFRKMALWVLWRWAWHDWFGLKKKIWLVGLSMVVRSYKTLNA